MSAAHTTIDVLCSQRIDVVVNNAGINQANLLRAVSAASAMIPMNTNFAGVIRVNQKACSPAHPPTYCCFFTVFSPAHSPLLLHRFLAAGHTQHGRVRQVSSRLFRALFCAHCVRQRAYNQRRIHRRPTRPAVSGIDP
jgi:NAD(P)-dependent dehydrogenase (short-subunit alcohol dehydrogenase family)